MLDKQITQRRSMLAMTAAFTALSSTKERVKTSIGSAARSLKAPLLPSL